MSTSFPGGVDAYTTRLAGQVVSPSHINNLQDAVMALEDVGVGPVAYNVKGYGALGDGATDDTTAVQAAIDAAAAVGGGIVFAPAGTYICETLTMKTGVYLTGVGQATTIFKLKASTDDDLIKGNGFASLTAGDTVAGIHDWGLVSLSLDGNKANNAATSYCLRFYGYRPFARDVDIYNGNDGGVYGQGFTATDPVGSAGLNRYGAWTRVAVHHNDGIGLYWNGIGDSTFTDCVFFYNTTSGVDVATRGNGTKFVNCHFYGNDQDYCARVASSGVQFIGCLFEGATAACLQLNAGAEVAKVIGNHFFVAGTMTVKIGVEVNNVSGTLIADNYFENLTDGAVKLTDDNGACSIHGNYIYATSGDAIAGTAATSTAIYGNQILGGANGEPGTSATIASGVATIKNGVEYGYIAGQGGVADDLTNIVPMRRKGTVVRFLASHALTLKNFTGSDGKIITGTGGDLAVAQFGVFSVISDDPNWIVI
jgi:hypothetical protein